MGQEISSCAPMDLNDVVNQLTRYDMNSSCGGVNLPPGHDILCSHEELESLCRSKLTPDDTEQMEEFSRVLRGVVHHEMALRTADVRKSYEALSPTPYGERMRSKMLERGKGELEDLEQKFIEQFLNVMNMADFSAISQGEWDMANEDSFMFNLPVDVVWDSHETAFLGKFLEKQPKMKEYMPNFSDRLMIFRQGSAVVTINKWLIQEKIEHLIWMLFFKRPLQLVIFIARLLNPRKMISFGKVSAPEPEASEAETQEAAPKETNAELTKADLATPRDPAPAQAPAPVPAADSKASAKETPNTGVRKRIFTDAPARPAKPTPPPPPPKKTGGLLGGVTGLIKAPLKVLPQKKTREAGALSFDRELMERKTMQKALPTVWITLKNLFKKVELAEPAFQNVVVLYRPSLKGEREAQGNPDIEEAPTHVNIKVFQDIPMADLEVVFPFKKVGHKYMQLLILIITTIIGLVVVFDTWRQGGESGMNLQVVQAIVAIIAARGIQTFNSMKKDKFEMEEEMRRIYIHKTKDNDEGALCYLLDSSEAQELKTVMLAYTYCLALMPGGSSLILPDEGVDMKDLAAAIDKDLRNCLGLTVVFDINDAVKKVVRYGLVTIGEKETLVPVPLSTGISTLKNRWKAAFD